MKKGFSMLLVFLLLIGCERNVIDKLGMIDAVGYDISEDDEQPLMVTVNYPSVTKQGTYQHMLLTVNAESSKDSRILFNQRSNVKLVSGQITVGLFGEDLAKMGVREILDTFMRDPSLGPRVYLAVTEGTAKDILRFKSKEGTNSSLYLRTFLEKLDSENERVNYNSYQFIRDYFDDGIDPIIPYFKIMDESIGIDGYALFQDDRYITHLTPILSDILFTLRNDTPRGTYSIEMSVSDKKTLFSDQLMFNYKKEKQDIDVKINGEEQISVEINIKLEGSLLEYTGSGQTDSPKTQKMIEEEIKVYLEDKSKEFFDLTKELKVDPIGIGGVVRNHMSYEKWKQLDWRETYPTIDIHANVEMKLVDTGQSK